MGNFPVSPDIVEAAFKVLEYIHYELFLFAGFWIFIGSLDEIAVDLCWLRLRLKGRGAAGLLPPDLQNAPLPLSAAVLVPAWREADVIGAMIRHTLQAWAQREFTLYVGVYRNDPDTLAAAIGAVGKDPRLRIVVHDRDGPTTKADCLNCLYAALSEDERRSGSRFGFIVLQDAEDMVHPAALAVLAREMESADFVQLPVRPEPQPSSPWVAGHYADEFAEAHAKLLVVRDSLAAGIPAAGVGCAFSREALRGLSAERPDGPFAAESLTEDYELGLLIGRRGGRSRFLRLRDGDGRLVATRSFFPARLQDAVRQKTRWIHGISLQGWDRLGWSGSLVERWMILRDRRGPMTALVLAAAYLLMVVEGLLQLAGLGGVDIRSPASAGLRPLIQACLFCMVWRTGFRFMFTAREYGAVEGIRAVLRVPVANIVAIMAGRRAVMAYLRGLRGAEPSWDKTRHTVHPAAARVHSLAERKSI